MPAYRSGISTAIDYARARGLSEPFGDVLHDNVAMLGLAKACGFTVAAHGPAPEVVRVMLPLKS